MKERSTAYVKLIIGVIGMMIFVFILLQQPIHQIQKKNATYQEQIKNVTDDLKIEQNEQPLSEHEHNDSCQ